MAEYAPILALVIIAGLIASYARQISSVIKGGDVQEFK
jgi:hypothetical protein